tara:strand:+ start:301 stop:474 length:174 start_codon:yes stop_codon:yes gene_type:complete
MLHLFLILTVFIPNNLQLSFRQIEEIGDGKPISRIVVIGTIVLFHINYDVYNEGKIE